jgi:hypothetical protein
MVILWQVDCELLRGEREGKMMIAICVVLILSMGYFGYMAINLKSKTFGGFVFGCVTLLTVIYLATSKDVINKVGSKAASVEPRLEKVEIATMRHDTIQTKIVTDQRQLKIAVDKLTEMIHHVDQKPLIMPGEDGTKPRDKDLDKMHDDALRGSGK